MTDRDGEIGVSGPGRPMSRGEFLGVGAMAAAGVGAGGIDAASDTQTVCRRPTACGSTAGKVWETSASVIQALWGDLLPRLIAFKWRYGSFPPPLGAFNHGLIDPDDLIEAAQRFLVDPGGGGSTLTCSMNSAGRFECAFTGQLNRIERRVKLLKDELKPLAPLQAIPIRLMKASGFDFILSDDGLDLFVPNEPVNEFEMLRFYQFRQTGRSVVGVPDYLDEPHVLAFDVQSPVGPSQVWSGDLTAINLSGCTLRTLVTTCLEVEAFDPWYRFDPAREGNPITFSLRDYVAATARVRCWQLEGSVYRGILEQLPRVVATVWREQLQACSPVDPQAYATRWGTARMREIFRERLETMLPDAGSMVFAVNPVLAAQDDVMISNQGIVFPALPAAPILDDMFAAIAEGRAGNPVFTDSRRPDGDE